MKLQPLAYTALLALTFGLSSCIQSDSSTEVNPDGSGKFTMKTTVNLGALGGLPGLGGGGEGGAAPDPSKEIIAAMLAGTKGVDVWKEVKSVKGEGGAVTITASGYFKDINKFSSGNPMDSAGGGKGGKSSGPGFGQVKSGKNSAGDWVIEVPLDMGGNAEGEEKPKAEAKPKLTDAEIDEKVKKSREEFAQMKPMMTAMLGSMKIGQTIKVAGTIKDYGMFTKVDANTVKMEIAFAKIFDAMEKMMNDPKTARKLASVEGGNPMEMLTSNDPETKEIAQTMIKAMFGGNGGEPKLTITPAAPLFDYEKEAAAAKAAQSPELKELLKAAEKKASDKDSKVVPPVKKAA